MITSNEFINLIKEKKYDKIMELANDSREEFRNLCDNINTRNYLANCDNYKVFELLNECKYSFTTQPNKLSGTQPLFITICKNDNISFETFEKILNFIPENEKQSMFQTIPDIKDLNGEYPLNTLIRSALFLPKDTENYEEKQKSFINKIKLLIEQGANIKAVDNVRTTGATSFVLLVSNPYIDVDYICSLIKKDKKILKYIDKQNDTVLHRCATSANLEVIKLLLENGLDIAVKNNNETIPLMLLCKNKNVTVEFLEELFKKYPKIKKKIKVKDKNNKNALHYAADGCNIEIMDFLANNEVNTTDVVVKDTPLMILIKNIKEKKVEITDEFINKFEKLVKNKNIQKSINILDDDKQNVLHEILKTSNNIKIIKILIKNGANIKQENVQGATPFMRLCKRNDIDADYLEELIKNNNITKKDINKIDDFGNSVLSTIVQNVNKDKKNILKLLIDRGADINIKNKDGKTIFDIAQENKDEELLEFLNSLKNKKDNIKSLQNNNKNTNATNVDNNSHNINNNTTLVNNKLPDLKSTTEKVATPHTSKTHKGKEEQENSNNRTHVVKDIKNNTKQETIKQNTQEQNTLKTNETIIADNNGQVNKSSTQNNNEQNTNNDIIFMLCLMFVIMNKNKYFGNSILFR